MAKKNQVNEVQKARLAKLLALYKSDGTHYVTELSTVNGFLHVVIDIPESEADLWKEANGRIAFDQFRSPEAHWAAYAAKGA